MTAELEQLVGDTVDFTGGQPPALLDERAPTLSDEAISPGAFYLVGLIGGKDVGKSALVNALVGEAITPITSFGPGTASVVAYAHESQAGELAKLLEREAPGQHRIVSHRNSALVRQVLLDLPDIDSHWQSHVELTREMLKQMLFPMWLQSVEKYADREPQQLLMQVAQGNAVDNFVFCLNKVDQLEAKEGGPAIEQLKTDAARRIGRALGIDAPKVWMLSAIHPEQYDFPELRRMLSQQKADGVVAGSKQLAGRQQDRSLGVWLAAQDIPSRRDRLARLQEEAEEILASRVGVPLLEQAVPALVDDPATRLGLADEILGVRTSRWPIVNFVHTALSPILMIVRRNVGATRSALLPDAEALVEAHLQFGGKPLADRLRGTFAQLQQSSPQISELYRRQRLWEDATADAAAIELRTALAQTLERQREAIRERLHGKTAALFAPVRWLLTIGAVIWFPFLQPIMLAWLDGHLKSEIPLLVVRLFGVESMLQNVTFLAIYFFLLWIILRWDTQRRVGRFIARWKSDSSDMSLSGQAVCWLDDLLMPIRSRLQRADSLVKRIEKFTSS